MCACPTSCMPWSCARRLPGDIVLNATTTVLVFTLALLTAAAPREARYDDAVFALAIGVAAWMYLLLVIEIAGSIRRFFFRRGERRERERERERRAMLVQQRNRQ